MSNSTKKRSLGSDSSKTIIAQAKREVPGFVEHFKKFERQVVIGGYSSSTLYCYGRAVAKVSLYFNKSLLHLDADDVNEFLYALAKDKKASSTYFKHTVYGLRFFYRLYDMEDRAIRLPVIRNDRKLIVVFSRAELKSLFAAPQRLKQRVILSLIYSAGLRVSELCNLKITDVDSDRMQLQIRNSKGNKSRYVILSDAILIGLRKYVASSKPSVYLFNGKTKGCPLGKGAVQQSFRLAMKRAKINKEASVHTLRHSYATHLLEDGLDIVTIKELLGHSAIETTMRYLHVAKVSKVNAHSPFDTLYSKK
ncbi:MAG: tyrosine-type recombinase/integrase [Crocinitomicaceae bacterium]|nr:tyrosine-type recombinase/integrase [Crocinitomicaceae bacterium]